ncbi:MAG: hypothetical protein M1826_000561 [Phylliscum demangeonii]|nr:MAG: hypothetical protein M1826_000561 [Phylliscum demangeonii]
MNEDRKWLETVALSTIRHHEIHLHTHGDLLASHADGLHSIHVDVSGLQQEQERLMEEINRLHGSTSAGTSQDQHLEGGGRPPTSLARTRHGVVESETHFPQSVWTMMENNPIQKGCVFQVLVNRGQIDSQWTVDPDHWNSAADECKRHGPVDGLKIYPTDASAAKGSVRLSVPASAREQLKAGTMFFKSPAAKHKSFLSFRAPNLHLSRTLRQAEMAFHTPAMAKGLEREAATVMRLEHV